MPAVLAYHRPGSVESALDLLHGSDRVRLLAGGTALIGGAAGTEEFDVVDLQSAGLAAIAVGEDRVVLGAMATLEDVRRTAGLHPAIAEAARRELPSTLRTAATVGGTLAVGEWDSELLATFLAHDPVVELHGLDGRREVPLPQLWDQPDHLAGRIITAVSVANQGDTRADRTGRTPADRPIVAAVARRTADGRVRLAMSGVAGRPVLVDDPARLEPPGDFRGSSEYRKTVATVLAGRVMGAW